MTIKQQPEAYFFNFESFDQEISKKISSLETDTDLLVKLLQDSVGPDLSTRDWEEVNWLYSSLKDLPFNEIYPNYLTHPIRVAHTYSSFQEKVTFDDVILGLCHNIIEAGVWERVDSEPSFLSDQVRRRIEILTIDRNQERDRDYLETYYGHIVEESPNLMLFKALDKLDNTLWWVHLDLKYYHAEIVLDHVCPRIADSHTKLEAYLRELTHYVLTDKAKTKFRTAQYGFSDVKNP